ncbi:acyltransferase [Paenibacillus daejeonensis]|uniref:acyltransferase n=1 Tax=Paenibacillus daejeonensis TaxID=135193 RepID=UPI0003687CE1|nr:acyltransferase [Paenibacillus daejeonensis]
MANEAKGRPIVEEFNLLRAFSILGVLMVHATSEAIAMVEKTSKAYPVYVALNTFAMFCVPAFIFLTGFVLFYNYYRKPITASMLRIFYSKRLMQILIPYLLISILFFFVRKALNDDLAPISVMIPDLLGRLLNGTAYTHLYYIFVLIQFYLLFPLLLFALQRWPQLGRWAIAVGFGVQWAFYFVNKVWLDVPSKGSVSLAYFAPFMLGVFVGIYYERIKSWFTPLASSGSRTFRLAQGTLWLTWIIASVGYIWLWYANRTEWMIVNSTWYELGYNIFTMTSILVLTQLAYKLYKSGPQLMISSLQRLAALSFGIYLIHPMLLLLYRAYPPNQLTPVIYHVWKAGGFVFALLGSAILLVTLYRLLPPVWLLFGPRPKMK